MASPQREDGYTPIANELMDAMARYDFGFSKGQVFMSIIRLTYGWHKKSDKISISRICEMTKLCKRTVIYTLQNLESQKKITIKRTVKDHEKQINEIAIQKNYDLWSDNSFAPPYTKLKQQAKCRSAKLRGSAKPRKEVVQNPVKKVNSFAHTKETTKEIIQKKTTIVEASPQNNYQLFKETWKRLFGKYPSGGNTLVDFPLKRLFKTFEADKICGMLIWIEENRDEYTPVIKNPKDLEDKWNSIIACYKKKIERKKNAEPIILT